MNHNYSIKRFTGKSYHTKIADPITGELKNVLVHELSDKNQIRHKGGWTMTYKKDRDDVILSIKGTKKLEMFFYIENQFSKKKSIIELNQNKIAKKFNTTQPYVSKLIQQMLDMNYIKRVPSGSMYMLNPFFIVPSMANALELQQEWAELFTKSINKKWSEEELIEYKMYLQSEEWRIKAKECKERAGNMCEECGSEKELEAHHKSYDNLYSEPIEDLQCLCKSCHQNKHQ